MVSYAGLMATSAGLEASPNELRAALADALSQMYAEEVPAYGHLVDATHRVNDSVGSGHRDSDRLGGERHGAIRVASFAELSQVARLFALYGMCAVGYYDLRSSPTPLPVVSTAFRPITAGDLAASPFRMFTSTLVSNDERFFSPELQKELEERLTGRELFSAELTAMIEQAEQSGGVGDAQRFVERTVDALRLDQTPIDLAWFEQLDAVSTVASDIAAAASTHINHLTPRVLDIDALHKLMGEEGIEMIERIQGPPAWNGPDLLLRQTSFRALDEQRTFTQADGNAVTGPVRVRFGEVEQRGIALTPQGRAKLDEAVSSERQLEDVFTNTVEGLYEAGDIYVEFVEVDGETQMVPITYEDFLPASAAGIFASNLARPGAEVDDVSVRMGEADLLRDAVGTLYDPYQLYQEQQDRSRSQGREQQ